MKPFPTRVQSFSHPIDQNENPQNWHQNPGRFVFPAEMNPRKLLFPLSAVLLIANLLLVSCGTPPYECLDPLGCLEIPPGSPVVIGAILATSGDQRPVGEASLQSVKKAVADKKYLLGHPIQLINYGTDCTAASAIMAATQFATYSDLSVVIGPTCNNEAGAAGPVLTNAGIPLLGPVPDSPAAYSMTNQVMAAIQHVAVLMPDKTLYIPRQELFLALNLSR
jgi:ABC-type branched-subunit amino acid transport system substrate-binding protein